MEGRNGCEWWLLDNFSPIIFIWNKKPGNHLKSWVTGEKLKTQTQQRPMTSRRMRQRSASDSEGEKSLLTEENEHGIFDWDAAADRRWTELREAELRRGFSINVSHQNKASVFVTLHSRSMVVVGSFFALITIGGTIASCLYFESDLQGLIYPFISETARDMPQTGFFAFGLTITSMFMVICAVLQYGKVKRDLKESDVGSKRNLVALILGIVAPPFLGLLACYYTKRACKRNTKK